MSVGLDIGSRTIKVVELGRDGSRFKLKAAGAVGVSGPSIDKITDEKDLANLAMVIKKLFHDTKISSKDVSISLPETAVFTRTLRFPMLTDQEVASAVRWEAEEYIPIPIKEAVVQHQIIDRRESGSPPQVVVLLVAAPRTLVEKYTSMLTIAGLNCEFVETSLLSAVRSLAPANQTVIILDIGAASTNLAIARNEQMMFSRSIQSAGEAMTRAVGQYLGVSATQAEEYKRTYGFSTKQLEGKVGASIEPLMRVISEEIKKVIHYYQVEEKGQTPTSVILTGGSAGLVGIATQLTKNLGVEILIGDPFSKIVVDPTAAQSLANFAPLYGVATGLAMR